MSEFFPVAINDDTFLRGPARLMWAGTTISFPTSISQIINLSTYEAMSGWNDLGATKGGITVTHNNTEEEFDVDQILTVIDTRPVSYEQAVSTNLAEASLSRLQVAWEAGPITTSGSEQSMGVGEPLTYVKRRLAVVFKKADNKLRAHVYRLVTKSPQESSLVYAKTGEQIQIPVRFRALADTSVADTYTRTQVVFNQV